MDLKYITATFLNLIKGSRIPVHILISKSLNLNKMEDLVRICPCTRCLSKKKPSKKQGFVSQ